MCDAETQRLLEAVDKKMKTPEAYKFLMGWYGTTEAWYEIVIKRVRVELDEMDKAAGNDDSGSTESVSRLTRL